MAEVQSYNEYEAGGEKLLLTEKQFNTLVAKGVLKDAVLIRENAEEVKASQKITGGKIAPTDSKPA